MSINGSWNCCDVSISGSTSSMKNDARPSKTPIQVTIPSSKAQFVRVQHPPLHGREQRRIEQALAAGWDMLVVDEAHHLGWSPEAVSPEYALVEALGRKTPGLLLLTATPEQLGMASHFARLRLLDPDRFYDLEEFIEGSPSSTRRSPSAPKSFLKARQLQELLDRHGTGRVRFRNTRATVAGFPSRIARLAPLKAILSRHPMVDWLASLLSSIDPEKVLAYMPHASSGCCDRCRIATANQECEDRCLSRRLSRLCSATATRPGSAEKDGARILICSEIGSEGRNFQFAHHLVLFDLPLDPELLEQRIGRLDRIGQTSEIQVHVPYRRWQFSRGSGALVSGSTERIRKESSGRSELLDRFGARLYELAQRFPKALEDRLGSNSIG